MSHLKKLNAPRKWHIARRDQKFVVRPAPSGHEMSHVLPLLVVMRDVLHVVQTARELKLLFKQRQVLVNGKMQTDLKASIGLLDVLSLPDVDKYYRVVIDATRRLSLHSISKADSVKKVAKVVRKNAVIGGKIQITLQDGRTMIADNSVNVGDSAVLHLPEGKMTHVVELKKGVQIYIVKGKASGARGTVVDFDGTEKVVYDDGYGNKKVTLKSYVVALGEDKAFISVGGEQ